jgi:putative ribosome biogenesis GTPase RsgA
VSRYLKLANWSKAHWTRLSEFAGVTSECRFTGSGHVAEPECASKRATTGNALTDRYARYIEIQAEIEDKRQTSF